jgi:hypothetical protein
MMANLSRGKATGAVSTRGGGEKFGPVVVQVFGPSRSRFNQAGDANVPGGNSSEGKESRNYLHSTPLKSTF